uniref:Ig-like domain-containing protein n=1 Tax=Buteo japonicus TaxID=224669 RepID=A0A8C0AR48_9AVES
WGLSRPAPGASHLHGSELGPPSPPALAAGPPEMDFLQQPQDKVSVTAGETLNLTCTTSGTGPTGPVKWLKGWDDGNETVYDQTATFPRVTQVVSESNTDFSIHIRDVRPEDAGTYYCVKFDKRVGGLAVVFRPMVTLFIHVSDNLLLIYIVVGVVCTVLALLVAAILYLIRAKQSKGKETKLHEPEKSSEATTQESDPNNLTYADLNFDRERKTVRRMVEMSQQSEYACIQTNRGPTGDDNLTYADLDMVHLSKAPRRPAPQPEEAGSEYASVQIPRK